MRRERAVAAGLAAIGAAIVVTDEYSQYAAAQALAKEGITLKYAPAAWGTERVYGIITDRTKRVMSGVIVTLEMTYKNAAGGWWGGGSVRGSTNTNSLGQFSFQKMSIDATPLPYNPAAPFQGLRLHAYTPTVPYLNNSVEIHLKDGYDILVAMEVR